MTRRVTGVLHIIRLNAAVDPVSAEYRIAFAPLGGRLGRRHVICHGLDQLTDFLLRAGLPIPEIEHVWRTLARRRFHAIPRVALTQVRIEELGL